MKHFFFFSFLGALLISLPVYGQNFSPCSTPSSKKALLFDDLAAQKLLAGPYVVQIFVHILRNDDGTNAAMSDADLQTNLNRMASFYQPHNICFAFVGRDFIDNTTWNINYTGGLIGALHAVNPHSDAIDIYVHKNGFDSSGGNAYNIPSDKCSVAANASFNFEHEMGHCLGLMHTFETASGTECPDGSNCGSAGDLVCDTPADFSGSQNSSSGCTYNGTQTISCNGGTFGYNPPTSNIMSYWAGCYNNFTTGQATRMYNTINSTAFLQARLAPADRIVTNITLTGEIAMAAQNSIQIGNIGAAGDVTMNGNANGIFVAGSYVQLVPGTQITPTGTNDVLLTINQLCDGVLFKNSISREDSPASAQSLPVSDKIEAYPNPFTDNINIRVSLSKSGPATLQLFDFTGRLVQSIDCRSLLETGSLYTELSLPTLMPGMYFLRLQHDGAQQTMKLAKLE